MTLREAFPETGVPVASLAEPITVKQTLVNARRLIVEEGWTQGRTRDALGRYCLLGALAFAGGEGVNEEAKAALGSTIRRYHRPPRRNLLYKLFTIIGGWREDDRMFDSSPGAQIAYFNDSPGTTKRDAIHMLDRAIERSER